MNEESLRSGAKGYDPDVYWGSTADSYPHYPTVRHRRRFIMNALRKAKIGAGSLVFDFGCGEGTLLQTIQEQLHMPDDHLGGCDISEQAIECIRKKIQSPHLHHALFLELQQPFDVMICCEVLEHTRDYASIVKWMAENLKPGGTMIVTTQSGRIHASDRYTGHTQHFKRKELTKLIQENGMEIRLSRTWGWPLFTLQKYLTNINFEGIQDGFLEGTMSWKKRLVFGLAYVAYFLHDLIPAGPQIYIVAKREKKS